MVEVLPRLSPDGYPNLFSLGLGLGSVCEQLSVGGLSLLVELSFVSSSTSVSCKGIME